MFRADAIYAYGDAHWNSKLKRHTFTFNKNVINYTDTFFMIFGPEQTSWIQGVIDEIIENNGVVLYQSPQAINFGYDDEPRNTLIVFEFNEVQV